MVYNGHKVKEVLTVMEAKSFWRNGFKFTLTKRFIIVYKKAQRYYFLNTNNNIDAVFNFV